MAQNENNEGGYVFISHSHKDIRNIRMIRNTLEENGLEPICFYLRCLSDDDEVLDLIKREIDAREWFLLVDSENARKSNWVKTEVAYIREKNPKKIVSVSLDDREGIMPVLNRLSRSMRVFLSYSRKDEPIARAIYDGCIKREFKVFFDTVSIQTGNSFQNTATESIGKAARQGCVVPIISESTLRSEHMTTELTCALSSEAYILPVIVDGAELPPALSGYLAKIQCYRLKNPVTPEQTEEIVEMIERLCLRRLHGE